MIIKASGIPVHCAHTKIEKIEKLVPHPKNPNRHSNQQIAMLSNIIQGVGWRNPIVVSKRSGYIIKGHARLEAAKMLKVTDVPVDEQAYENEALEWQDLIADNRMSELSEIDYEAINKMFDEDVLKEFDLDLMGFDFFSRADIKEKTNDLQTQTPTEEQTDGNTGEQVSDSKPSEGSEQPATQAKQIIDNGDEPLIQCPECGHKFELP